MRLNLGSYIYPLQGYVNVDVHRWDGVDIVADLNILPWPWESKSVNEIRALDIIEHLGKLTKVEIIAELARITVQGAKVHIRVPCSSHPIALQSLQHAHIFYFDSFDRDYAQPHFRCVRRWVTLRENKYRFEFKRPFRLLFRIMGRLGLIYCLEFELVRAQEKLTYGGWKKPKRFPRNDEMREL